MAPVGYTVTPAGKQTNLGALPLGAVVSPDGRWLVVSNDGQDAQSLQVIDTATSEVTQTVPYPAPAALFVGLAFTRDGKTPYASGGNTVSVLDLRGSEPAQQKTITVGTHPNKAVASADGRTLYVANGDSDEISVIDAVTAAVTRTISLAPYRSAQVGSNPDALALSPVGRRQSTRRPVRSVPQWSAAVSG